MLRTLVVVLLLVVSCGKSKPRTLFEGKPPVPPEEVVVRAHAELVVKAGARGASGTQPVTVVNAAQTKMTVDNSKFSPPTITNAILSFGSLAVSDLLDNNLKVCGASGKDKCGTALLRIYTKDAAGPGLWNVADGTGAPITSSLTSPLTVGLGVSGAAVMQTFAIPANKPVMHLTDFTPAPKYDISADFTDAGAGSYSTTIVIEYALAP